MTRSNAACQRKAVFCEFTSSLEPVLTSCQMGALQTVSHGTSKLGSGASFGRCFRDSFVSGNRKRRVITGSRLQHKDVMIASSRDDDRPLGHLLAANVGEILVIFRKLLEQ